jgi:small-conductance mechanosensitive channel
VNAVLDWLRQATTSPSELRGRLAATLAVVLIFWAVRWLSLRIAYRRASDPRALYQWRKGITYAAFALGFLAIGRIWSAGFASASTFLGLLSAGLAIALQDPIVNLAGWLFIVWRRPFEVGDRIQVGEHKGDVIDIRVFQFTLLEVGNWVAADQSTGRVIHIPNGKVFKEALANYTQAFAYIWHEIPVLVTFESDWKKAKRILAEIGEKHALPLSEVAAERIRAAAQRFMIFYAELGPIVYTSVADSGVLLTLRYLCDPKTRRSAAEAIWEEILERFAECDDIDFAYPTHRLYTNTVEGKPGARAEPPTR